MSEEVRAEQGGIPSGVSRVRDRIAARFGGSRPVANPALVPLVEMVRREYPKADTSIVERAYAVAERLHAGQQRRNGDDYITHPLAVARILAELGMPPSVVAAGLLHDTVEDTDYTLADITRDFGAEIAGLVDAVTKLDKVTFGEAAKAETIRKMVVAMAQDVRVLVIKLADRLHNARTWKYIPPEAAARQAAETLEIYAPLAHRLGMNTLKWELEDLSFAAQMPRVYEEIVQLVAERAPSRDQSLAAASAVVVEDLANARIKATVTGRPKHYYSIYQKMIVRGRDFDDIYDLIALRVLVETVRDCYSALGAMHARWTPVPGRFKDYIAMPKFNMYQSLHTTVIGPEGKPVEIQIRTHTMHRRAEIGVADHYKYKMGDDGVPNPTSSRSGAGADMTWLRQILDWQRDTEDPDEFLDALRYEVKAQEVYAFTPKGSVMALPIGSTAVDFAYAVHTEVGHRCIGARVNGRLVPLDSQLENGDVVEVLTSKSDTAGPSQDWLNFVKSARARNKIKQWYSRSRREESVDKGREALAKVLRKQRLALHRLMSHETLTAVASDLRYADIDALYAAIGENHISAQSVVHRLVASIGGVEGATEDLAEATIPKQFQRRRSGIDSGVAVVGASDVVTKLARCCMPVPGDEILGFVTRGQGVSVHRTDCSNAHMLQAQPDRIKPVEWHVTASSRFIVGLEVEAIDRQGLAAAVVGVFNEHRLALDHLTMDTSADRVATGRFTFEIADMAMLDHVVTSLARLDGVHTVRRVTGTPQGSHQPTPA